MYVWVVHHIIKQIIGRPGKVADPARGRLNREHVSSPVPVCAGEFGLAKKTGSAVPSRASSLVLYTQVESGVESGAHGVRTSVYKEKSERT